MTGKIGAPRVGAVAAALVAAIAALAVVTQASAQGPEVLSLGSITIRSNAATTLDLRAEGIGEPGLGAWELGLVYDPTVLAVEQCIPTDDSQCNPAFAPNRVQLAGADDFGLIGDVHLADVRFRCLREGTSQIEIVVDIFADATEAGPVPFAPKVQNGKITCSPVSEVPGTTENLRGDTNCDGIVTAVDAQLILQLEAGFIRSVPCPLNADVDRNGRINAIDAELIKQFVGGLIRL
ncbi:MAG: dockerin type I domain-containing protein [Dehalococcoidia bacterium]